MHDAERVVGCEQLVGLALEIIEHADGHGFTARRRDFPTFQFSGDEFDGPSRYRVARVGDGFVVPQIQRSGGAVEI